MLIEGASKYYLKKIRAKAKMYEYGVPEDLHIKVEEQANDLILLSIGIVGDVANEIMNMKQAPIILSNETEEIYFVARFFDSYFQSRLDIEMNPYYILMGAAAYYFCNMNGSARVMMNILSQNIHQFEFSASGLENVIIWLLDSNYELNIDAIDQKYRSYVIQLITFYDAFFDCEKPTEIHFNEFRHYVYQAGNDREILFIDIILAIFKKRIYNSCLHLMPKYSHIAKKKWITTFKNNPRMKEMWPSQILLGDNGIFTGKSGVIQMPTSSGKTTSVALAIQAAFLSHRTSIAVVVAPFRALCKEIMFDMERFFAFDVNISVTEFSDIPEPEEIKIATSESVAKKIFVMTPEKLAYILKHNVEIIESLNMIVFDEAHLFDDVSRGTDYELLLTTINHYLKPDAQKILVSAVIPNAEQLNDWINQDGVVIKNSTIKTSEKTVAFNTFTSSKDNNAYSNLYFVNPDRFLEEEFYVPRVVQTIELKKLNNERKARYFPDLSYKQDVGIYYAIKLIRNGSIAIFCSTKDTVNRVLKRFDDLKARGVSLDDFINLSDKDECLKIANLIEEHMGQNDLYVAALNGIVGHHAGIPNGIRAAEEYALKKSLVRCVVCTSTLAQGVNLPIKYLIVSNAYQSGQIIKVRDFHNLIGRTARAGKETEGTIILTENVYKTGKNNYKLDNYRKLLNADNSEACSSNLLKLVRDINYEEYLNLKNGILAEKKKDRPLSDNYYNMNEIERILVSLENFILGFTETEGESYAIIQETFGYYLADDKEKKELTDIYNLIKSNIDHLEAKDRQLYKKSMIGIFKMRDLTKFIDDHLDEIVHADFDALIEMIANKLKESGECKVLPKFIDKSHVHELLKMWLNGETYSQILNYSKSVNLQMKRGKQSRNITIEDIITLCDSDFGYVSLAIIQAIIEILNTRNCGENIQDELNDIILRIRYGLPNKESVYVYEIGFVDRIISQKIAYEIRNFDCSTKKKTKHAIKKNRDKIRKILSIYPSYFMDRLEKIR